LATGKKLWSWYNCSGCHANGGGGSGPALMDDVWIYGGDATSIFQTISQGRPNGMPAFGKRIPKDQVWALAAYVRSMAGLAPQDAAPNRDDAFLTRTPESFMDSQKQETAKPSSGSGRTQ
jgi:cytochrome c oxidase cbb3-type subunit 3